MLQIKKDTIKRESSEAPIPDSTTIENKSYVCGEEVLVHLKDDRFYLGFIAKLRYKESKCLVKFGDSTVKWVLLKSVTRMSCTSVTAQFCNVCNIEALENEICVCDKCANVFHRKCHKPEVTCPDISSWMCYLCKEKQQISRLQVINSVSSTEVHKITKLPYDLNSLQWDIHHRINNLGTYCYCGGSGDWFIKMLQCVKCLQWFHEKCLSSLIYPLYLGDRFYVFLCSVCTQGNEFVRRIEMEWADLVHLALFNMTAYKPQKYYDVDSDILLYLDTHWNSMYLPPKILDVPIENRKIYIVNALLRDTNHRFEFQGKKPANMWGLRLKLPPKPPRFSLPTQVSFTEDILHHKLQHRLNLNILPPPKKTDYIVNRQLNDSMYTVEGLKFLHQDSPVVMLPKGLPSIGHNVCIKSAAPIVPAPRSIIEKRIRQQQIESNKRTSRNCNMVPNKLKKPMKKEKVPESRSPSRSTESTPEKSLTASEEELSNEEDADYEDLDDEDDADADSLRTADLQSRRSQRLSVNRLLSGRPINGSAHPRETRAASSITLPLSLAPVITQGPQVRTTKRRLSEKDLRIDHNGKCLVKRKRLRRNGFTNGSLTPTKRQSKNNFNGRIMYKSYSEFFANHSHSVNRPSSPENTVDSPSDLKTLVHSYFGASNRIANGEEYTILCKRINPDGSEEFLIRWD
ncbi:PHD finger protein 19 [Daktulosphaira vitifoliae]|uniref:PHD finger protein 19 n=1 Tax=Daktulosphaira vitifoliae TaxID=58002 RepID=UPI0021AA01D7|nr:PHD finger protein 19 [Daktulosphaira vitifoliae]XP_050530589.1 PHD finger protein 19 [Daktulosphaira vitifoliae]XP_050530594.1 PHD finger protein 19 [Daktulosphaira vitifoliae]